MRVICCESEKCVYMRASAITKETPFFLFMMTKRVSFIGSSCMPEIYFRRTQWFSIFLLIYTCSVLNCYMQQISFSGYTLL